MKLFSTNPENTDYATTENDFLWSPEKKEKEPVPRIFPIWYIRDIPDLPHRPKFSDDDGIDEVTKKNEAHQEKTHLTLEARKAFSQHEQKLYNIVETRITQVQEDITKRPFLLHTLAQNDIAGEIALAYDEHKGNMPPEMIIIESSSEISETNLIGNEVAFIKEKIHQALEKRNLLPDESLLQPIIITIAQDIHLRQLLVEQGTHVVLKNFDKETIEKLAQLTAKIKSDFASLYPEELKREKSALYEFLEPLADRLEQRTDITAHTEKEVKIINTQLDAYKKQHTCTLLTVTEAGCGYGRISNEIAERDDVIIYGFDMNEQFIKKAQDKANNKKNVSYSRGDILNYPKSIEHNTQDVVIYSWNTILEAHGPGNTIKTLNNVWLALKPNGLLIFDMPTRTNKGLEDGRYYKKVNENIDYLSYIPEESEVRFFLTLTGFDGKHASIEKWCTKPSGIYPEGMEKITVTARKEA